MEGDNAGRIAAAGRHPARRGEQGRHSDLKHNREDHGTESKVGQGADSSGALQ